MSEFKEDKSIEAIFGQLTEDITQYQWALLEWFEPSGKYSDLHLFLEIFSRRSRAIRLVSELANITPEKDRKYFNRLKNMMNEEEEQYQRFLRTSERIRKVFHAPLKELLSFLRSKLEEITRISEDAIIFGDPSLLREDFPEATSDFLHFFTRLNYVRKQHQELGEIASPFCREFDALEASFKENFYRFEPLSKQLSIQRRVLLPSAREWWYMTEPDPYRKLIFSYLNDGLEAEEKEVVENHLKYCEDCRKEMEKGVDFLKTLSGIRFRPVETKNCLGIRALSSYAFNEMTHEEIAEAEGHILTCDHCMSEVIHLRTAEQAISEKSAYRSLPDFVKIKYYMNSWYERLSTMAAQVELRPALAAREESQIRNIGKAAYKISMIPTADKNIRLMDPKSYPSDLLPVTAAIDGQQFFYRVFGIYANGSRKEIHSGTEEYLPIIIPWPDTDYLILVISQKKEVLRIEEDLLFKILDGGTAEPTKDLIFIFAEIGGSRSDQHHDQDDSNPDKC